MIWLILVILAVLYICYRLIKLLDLKNTDKNYIEDRKKFFPTRLMKPPKAPGPPSPKMKDGK